MNDKQPRWKRTLWRFLDFIDTKPQHPAQRVSPKAINLLKCEFCREEVEPKDPRHMEGRCVIWLKGWTPGAADALLLSNTNLMMRKGFPARDVI